MANFNAQDQINVEIFQGKLMSGCSLQNISVSACDDWI